MNEFREELAVFEFEDGRRIRLMSTSIWEGKPTNALFRTPSDDDEYDFLMLIPDVFVVDLRRLNKLEMFIQAAATITQTMLETTDGEL